MKGWHYESWRHSLAAKGIKTKSFAIKDWIADYRAGKKMVEARGRRILAEAEKPVAVPSSKFAPLTEREEMELAKQKFIEGLRPRERRLLDVSNLIKTYVGDKREDETTDEYLTRIRDKLGKPIWTSWARSEYVYVQVGDKVVPREVPQTLGEQITDLIEEEYGPATEFRAKEEKKPVVKIRVPEGIDVFGVAKKGSVDVSPEASKFVTYEEKKGDEE